MNGLITAIPTGLMAFMATNLDDIIILLLFFSQINQFFRRQHIVTGQYLGFAVLVLASLPGFFGSVLLPRDWIGLLGLVPIAIGISRLLNADTDNSEEVSLDFSENPPWFAGLLSPQTYSVAAVTFANGGDNIGIYIPLFAHSSAEELIGILGVFFSLVGVWCYTAWRLTCIPVIAEVLTRYGNQLVPFVLMGLGGLILVDSHTLENRGLATLALTLGGLIMLMLLHNSGKLPSILPDSQEG
ncbi:cadmium resistance transporter [Alkalinema pantanalense CENA528]|uniref:cadmium resistance transporter n=1 Tax=Alkalinema pantanalense TaxID=1620705 RepID=UPI003D6E691C